MKVFISKCNSFLQRDQSFDFQDEEWDLSEEILSEGTTAKSTSFENNMQFNMEKVNFKSKKVVRSGKWNQQNTNAKENINLELSHAVERSDALLEVRKVPNSPCFSAYKLEESKSNKSRSIINASIPTRTTLKDEIRQLLRWLALERNNSSVKVDSKHHDEALKLDNKNLCHLEVNTRRILLNK